MKISLIDIHCHINFNAFKDDGHTVVERTLKEGTGMILVGSQIDTSRRAVEYAHRYDNGVWAAVALHPIHLSEFEVDAEELEITGVGGPASPAASQGGQNVPGFKTRAEEFNYDKYKELGSDSKTIAIGECGLDYFHCGEEEKKKQAEVFRKQIKLARELKKPIMVHCRNAYDDLFNILKEEDAQNIGGDIHFFAGDWDTAKKFLDLGFHLSFTGVITFAHQYDEVIKKMPLDRIMVETDAPYVAPAPYRGKRNEPLYVKEVAKRIAAIKDISYEQAAEATTNNAINLFKLFT
ncbi:TatD family hydrolase [Patescibacteria group bacterium]